MQKAVEREDASFAVGVCPQDEDRVFETYDEREGPNDEGDAAKNVVSRGNDMGRAVKYLVDGIERRCANVT